MSVDVVIAGAGHNSLIMAGYLTHLLSDLGIDLETMVARQAATA